MHCHPSGRALRVIDSYGICASLAINLITSSMIHRRLLGISPATMLLNGVALLLLPCQMWLMHTRPAFYDRHRTPIILALRLYRLLVIPAYYLSPSWRQGLATIAS